MVTLEILRDLRKYGIHSTLDGVRRAAKGGHLAVIEDLTAHGVPCTQRAADEAAKYGHLTVLQYF